MLYHARSDGLAEWQPRPLLPFGERRGKHVEISYFDPKRDAQDFVDNLCERGEPAAIVDPRATSVVSSGNRSTDSTPSAFWPNTPQCTRVWLTVCDREMKRLLPR